MIDIISEPQQIDVRSELAYSEFIETYALPRVPVVFTDAIEKWRAVTTWTPEYLREKIGNKTIKFRGGEGAFDELTDQILASTPENPGVYMENVHLQGQLPEICKDASPRIQYAVPDWKSSRLMPKDWLFPNGVEGFFFAGLGTTYPRLHIDYYGVDAFLSQIYGEKEFLIFAPDQTKYLYPREDNPWQSMIDDPENPDYERFPLYREAEPIRWVLKPGQTLFCPNGWWHTTRMLSTSMTIVTTSVNAANWTDFSKEISRQAKQNPSLKRLLLSYHVKFVGALLRLHANFTH